MTIDFKITNQTLKCVSQYSAAEGTENYIKLQFDFTKDWDGLTKTLLILCRGEDIPTTICLDEDNCCYVPASVYGVCGMSLTGTDGNVTVTTNIISMCFENTLPVDSGLTVENSSSDFSSLIQKLSEKADKVPGKGLSENDFTDELKNKLENAAAVSYVDECINTMNTELNDKVSQSYFDNAYGHLSGNIDTINKALTGVYKNKGDVSELTLDLPVTDLSLINNMYNVKDGYIPVGSYGGNAAFRYRINIAEAYILEGSYALCFKLSAIPFCLLFTNIIESKFEFVQNIAKYIHFSPNNSSDCWTYDFPTELPSTGEGLDTVIYLPLSSAYGITPETFFEDKVFTGGKYQLGTAETIWYRNDIQPDDNFAITENGYDVLSYKVSDYVSKSTFDSLSEKVDTKADANSVYTKAESDESISKLKSKTMLVTEASGENVAVLKNVCADEKFFKCNIHGTAEGLGTADSSTGTYSIKVNCANKNLLGGDISTASKGVIIQKNDDNSITVNGTATSSGFIVKFVSSGVLPPGTYYISGCPDGGSRQTYCVSTTHTMPINDSSASKTDMGNGVILTLDEPKRVSIYINVKSGAVFDNLVFKPQLERGEARTEYVKGEYTGVTATLDSALGENEYIDVVSKKRYSGENVTDIEVDGELSTVAEDMNFVYCAMSQQPSQICSSCYRDVTTEFELQKANVYTKEETDAAIAAAIEAYSSKSGTGGTNE